MDTAIQIRFLGTGGAFDYELGNASAWVNWQGLEILIDCGSTIFSRLRTLELAGKEDYVFITHLHDDHVGSLCSYVLYRNFVLKHDQKTRIVVPEPAFEDELYRYLAIGMTTPEHFVTFVQASEVSDKLRVIPTTDRHVPGMRSYAYLFEEEHEVLLYSGDMGDPDFLFSQLAPYAGKKIRVFHDMAFEATEGVHAHYRDLQAKLHIPYLDLFAYHLDPRMEPADNQVPLVANFPDLLF